MGVFTGCRLIRIDLFLYIILSDMLANIDGIGIFFSRLDVLFILPLLLILFVYEVISLMKSRKMDK